MISKMKSNLFDIFFHESYCSNDISSGKYITSDFWIARIFLSMRYPHKDKCRILFSDHCIDCSSEKFLYIDITFMSKHHLA